MTSGRLSRYDAGRCAGFAEAWLEAAAAQYMAERWAAQTTTAVTHRTALRFQAEGFALLCISLHARLRVYVGEVRARQLCLDTAAGDAAVWAARWQRARAPAAVVEQGGGR